MTSSHCRDLRIATVGDYDVSLSKLNSSRQVPIVVKLQDDARRTCRCSNACRARCQGPVLLGQVATLSSAAAPAVVDRYDRARNVNFEIELSGQPLGDVTQAVAALPSITNLPPGVRRARSPLAMPR